MDAFLKNLIYIILLRKYRLRECRLRQSLPLPVFRKAEPFSKECISEQSSPDSVSMTLAMGIFF